MAVESNTNNPNEMTEVLLRVGARTCTRCATRSLIPAQDSDDIVWFCFECGYHTSRIDAVVKEDEPPFTPAGGRVTGP